MTEIDWFVQYMLDTKGGTREGTKKSSQKSPRKNPLFHDGTHRTSAQLRMASLRNRIARRRALEE